MKVTLSISDETYELLKKQAARKNRDGVEAEIVERLERFAPIPSDDRAVCLFGAERRELEKVFQTTIDSPADLISKVKRLCTVKIDPIERQLTAGELAILHTQAQFMGLPPDEYLQTFLTRVLDESLGRI